MVTKKGNKKTEPDISSEEDENSTFLQSIRTDNPSRILGGDFDSVERERKMRKVIELHANAHTLSECADIVGISRVLVYNWKKTFPLFKEALEESREQSADFYLKCLKDSALELNPASIKLGLVYTRALSEAQKVEHSGNVGVIEFRNVEVDPDDDSRAKYASELERLREKHGTNRD